jgi:uncharacterized protein DUF6869
MDNYYEPATGRWVTAESRYDAIADQPRFRDIDLLAPEEAWPRILELLAAVPEDTVYFVGAGPLETFVRRHGGPFIGRIDREVRNNPRFRDAAREINLERGELPSVAEERLLAALGPGFRLSDPED